MTAVRGPFDAGNGHTFVCSLESHLTPRHQMNLVPEIIVQVVFQDDQEIGVNGRQKWEMGDGSYNTLDDIDSGNQSRHVP